MVLSLPFILFFILNQVPPASFIPTWRNHPTIHLPSQPCSASAQHLQVNRGVGLNQWPMTRLFQRNKTLEVCSAAEKEWRQTEAAAVILANRWPERLRSSITLLLIALCSVRIFPGCIKRRLTLQENNTRSSLSLLIALDLFTETKNESAAGNQFLSGQFTFSPSLIQVSWNDRFTDCTFVFSQNSNCV